MKYRTKERWRLWCLHLPAFIVCCIPVGIFWTVAAFLEHWEESMLWADGADEWNAAHPDEPYKGS